MSARPMAPGWIRSAWLPALIALGPILLLPDFWALGRLTDQHVDLLPFWLPRWCFLGRSLASGHLPTWLPHQFGGVPFVSDPQSGWLSVPAMALFSTLPCHRALGILVALNPVIAGLGLFAFLRIEGLERPAAAAGGLTLALVMAGSSVALSMPFSATLAWTAVALAGASGYLRSRMLRPALGWLALAAFGLSQVAAAHLANGLAIAAVVLVPYVVARSVLEVRDRGRPVGAVLARLGTLAVAAAVLGAAVVVPRLALLPRTAIGMGYQELSRVAGEVSGRPPPSPFADRGLDPWWGTAPARGPGGYVGAVALLLGPLALASRRWRLPAAAFALTGLAGWALNLDVVVRSETVRRAAMGTGLGELWLRDPRRLTYLLLVAFAALAGYGVQAWMDRASSGEAARTAAWVLPGVTVFAVAPLAAGSPPGASVPFALGLAAAIPLLLWVARGHTWAALALPVLVAVELTSVGLVGRMGSAQDPAAPAGGAARSRHSATARFARPFAKLRWAPIDGDAYLNAGPIAARLRAERGTGDYGRYLSFQPGVAEELLRRGRPTTSVPPSAYADGRAILFGLDEVQGYSPLQLERYWRLIRRAASMPLFHNAATLPAPHPGVLELFGVGWVIAPEGAEEAVGEGREVGSEGGRRLLRLSGPVPRATLAPGWATVGRDRALDAVLEPSSDGRRPVLVEGVPRVGGEAVPRDGGGGRAEYRELAPGHARVRVRAGAPSVLVVRNAFDPNWEATVDGEAVPVLVAEYMMQAVAVPAGNHEVDLRYRDRAVGVGAAISAAGWGAVGLAILAASARARRQGRDAGTDS